MRECVNQKKGLLPIPLAVHLAVQTKPVRMREGVLMGATADDETTSGLTTYTDDPS